MTNGLPVCAAIHRLKTALVWDCFRKCSDGIVIVLRVFIQVAGTGQADNLSVFINRIEKFLAHGLKHNLAEDFIYVFSIFLAFADICLKLINIAETAGYFTQFFLFDQFCHSVFLPFHNDRKHVKGGRKIYTKQ